MKNIKIIITIIIKSIRNMKRSQNEYYTLCYDVIAVLFYLLVVSLKIFHSSHMTTNMSSSTISVVSSMPKLNVIQQIQLKNSVCTN